MRWWRFPAGQAPWQPNTGNPVQDMTGDDPERASGSQASGRNGWGNPQPPHGLPNASLMRQPVRAIDFSLSAGRKPRPLNATTPERGRRSQVRRNAERGKEAQPKGWGEWGKVDRKPYPSTECPAPLGSGFCTDIAPPFAWVVLSAPFLWGCPIMGGKVENDEDEQKRVCR